MKIALHTDRSYRIKRFGYYFRTVRHALRNNVQARAYLRLAFDRLLRADSAMPHMLYVELSNVCNTRRVYCPCRAYHFDEPYFQEDVLEKIIASLSHQPVDKIIIGGGEPTLHPEFVAFARRLKHCAKFLSVVSNGQWTDDRITETLANGMFNLVEISVDAGGKKSTRRCGRERVTIG